MKRNRDVDTLRGLSVLAMIVVHFVSELAGHVDKESLVYALTTTLLSTLTTHYFLFFVGVNFILHQARTGSPGEVYVGRGRRVFLLGMVLSAFFENNWFCWDVLPLIGISLMMLPRFSLLPRPLQWTAVATLIVAAPWLREWLNYGGYWDAKLGYSMPSDPQGALAGLLANGYFPVFPWLYLPFLGALVGTSFFRWSPPTLAVGSVLCFGLCGWLGYGGMSGPYFGAPSFYPLNASFIALQFSILLCSPLFLRLFEKCTRGRGATFLPFVASHSLSLYVVHLLCIEFIDQWRHTTWGYSIPSADVACLLGLIFILGLKCVSYRPGAAAWLPLERWVRAEPQASPRPASRFGPA